MSEPMTQPHETCWATAWEPIELEEDCEFADHPHEGPHIRCGLCWISRRHGELLREREADRAAINAMKIQLECIRDDAYQLEKEATDPGEKRTWTAIAMIANKPLRDHAAAIQRAQDAKA